MACVSIERKPYLCISEAALTFDLNTLTESLTIHGADGGVRISVPPHWMAQLASHEGLASIGRQPGLPPGVGPLPRPPGDPARSDDNSGGVHHRVRDQAGHPTPR